MHASTPLRIAAAFSMLAASPAHAELSAEELAKLAQNPVGNLISPVGQVAAQPLPDNSPSRIPPANVR